MNFKPCFLFTNVLWICNDFLNWFCWVYVQLLFDYFLLQTTFVKHLLHYRLAFYSILSQSHTLLSLIEYSFDFHYFHWGDQRVFNCTIRDKKWTLWFDVNILSWFLDRVQKVIWEWLLCTCNHFEHQSLWKFYLHLFDRNTIYNQNIHLMRWSIFL